MAKKSNASIKKMAELNHIRSMTKKALAEERKASRKDWNGMRSAVIATGKDKKQRNDRQTTRAALKAYCY